MWSTNDETLDILRDLYSDADDLVEKQVMDECTSEIFMGGKNTIVMHNTCEDSLLVTPLIYHLVNLGELCERITMKKAGEEKWEAFHPVLSLLSYIMLKAPLVPSGLALPLSMLSSLNVAPLSTSCVYLSWTRP